MHCWALRWTTSCVRLLVLYVAEAREPVEDPDGRLRWRTGGHCVLVDRAEWWLHRQDRAGSDPMAAATDRSGADVAPGAVLAARRFLSGSAEPVDVARDSDPDLLRKLGVLRPDGRLTQAGALVFCRSEQTHLALSVLDVERGDVLTAPADLAGLSLLEQVAAVEARLDTLNTAVTLRGGFAEHPVRRLPPAAAREVVLNGVVHRDWMQPDPVAVTWVEADSALQVVSPGGFVGGVSPGTLSPSATPATPRWRISSAPFGSWRSNAWVSTVWCGRWSRSGTVLRSWSRTPAHGSAFGWPEANRWYR